MYTGLSASILRQMSYTLVRFGSYEEMKARISKDGRSSAIRLLIAASIAGGLGGMVGNPAGTRPLTSLAQVAYHHMPDILLVRMTSDFTRPPEKRYNYRNALSGLINLVNEEGVRGLGRGLGTNTVRDSQITLASIFSLLKQTRAILMNVNQFYVVLKRITDGIQ